MTFQFSSQPANATADATNNSTLADVVGSKTDAAVTAVGTTKSIEAYVKGLVTMGTVQTADATNNAFAGDVVGNKTDATIQVVGTTKSLAAYLKGAINALAGAGGVAAYPASAAPANAVSLAAVLRELFDQSEKTISTSVAQVLTLGTNTAFTVAGGGIEILNLGAQCVTANGAGQATTLQWAFDGTNGSATTITGASGTLASLVAGDLVFADLTLLTTTPILMSTTVSASLGPTVTQRLVYTNGPGILTMVVGTASSTGTWNQFLRYRPLNRGVTVTAAF